MCVHVCGWVCARDEEKNTDTFTWQLKKLAYRGENFFMLFSTWAAGYFFTFLCFPSKL